MVTVFLTSFTIGFIATIAVVVLLFVMLWSASATMQATETRHKRKIAQASPQPDYARIAELERELGMGDHRGLLVSRSELNKLIIARTQRTSSPE